MTALHWHHRADIGRTRVPALTFGMTLVVALLGGSLHSAVAATGQPGPDVSNVLANLPGYLLQAIGAFETSAVSVLDAYHLSSQSLQRIALVLAVLVVLLCLMVKAFRLGKQAAERTARRP